MDSLQPLNIAPSQSVREAMNASPQKAGMRFACNQADGDDPAELIVMGDVGSPFDGLAADQVVAFLAENAERDITVRINSPGGLAFDGITIFNALLNHEANVTTVVEGQAGSAAALIAMAGNPVRMMANASFFMHRALALSIGNATVMRDAAEFLDVVDDGIVATFQAKTSLSAKKLNELLDGTVDGTTLSAKEAKTLGFVDEVVELRRKKKTGASSNTASTVPTASTTAITANLSEPSVEFVPDAQRTPKNTVPSNPPNGTGEGVGGEWNKPALSDFVDAGDRWEDLGPSTRMAIARHFAWVPTNLAESSFADLKLPHHFASNHPQSGKVSLNGVRNALARLDQTDVPDEDKSRIESHLQAHLSDDDAEDASTQWADEVDDRMVELRLAEIGA